MCLQESGNIQASLPCRGDTPAEVSSARGANAVVRLGPVEQEGGSAQRKWGTSCNKPLACWIKAWGQAEPFQYPTFLCRCVEANLVASCVKPASVLKGA